MPIQYARERRIMLELVLGLREDAVDHYFARYRGRTTRTELDMLALILRGHIIGRPMTVSALSRATSTPMATMTRRLAAMASAGLIVRKGNSYCVAEDKFNAPPSIALVQKSIGRIVDAATQLKKVYPK